MEPFSTLDVLSNIPTNIKWIVFEFWEVKSILVLVFLLEYFIKRAYIRGWRTYWIIIVINTFHRTMHQIVNEMIFKFFCMFRNSVCCNSLAFHKICTNIYRMINIFIKKCQFLFSIKCKTFCPYCRRLSGNETKYTEIVVLKFKKIQPIFQEIWSSLLNIS